jgi:hypothetical protein
MLPVVPRFLQLFAVSLALRVLLLAVGVALATLPPFPYDDPQTPHVFADEAKQTSARVIEPWYRYDAVWMLNIARNSYLNAKYGEERLGVAFFPAMPLTLAFADSVGLNIFWFGLVVANLCSAVGTAIFARLVARELEDSRAGWSSLFLLHAFPTSFFLSAAYNEPIGLLFTAILLQAWQNNRAFAGGIGSLGGSLARMTGGVVAVAACCDWLRSRKRPELPRAAFFVVGSLGGIALYWSYLWWLVGNPFAGLEVQGHWGRHSLSWKNPFRTLASIHNTEQPNASYYGEAVLMILFIVAGIRALRKRGVFFGALILLPIAQMFMSGTLLSAHRIILAALPAFLEFADYLRDRVRVLYVVLTGCAVWQLFLLNRYVHWIFAG